jgi:hypothetical protein
MTKISTYVIDEKITALDKWIGSDANMQNRTKNFTPKKLAEYFNENQVINIGIPLQYKYYTLDPLEQRPNGTLTFVPERGSTVDFSTVTTFILSKYTMKQNIVSDFLDFLVGSKVLLFKSSDINSFGYYKITSIDPYIVDPNFFVVTVDYETGNGELEEDKDYMISLVSLDDNVDKTFVFTQSTPANPWIINHNLDKFPSVTMVLSTGQVGVADVRYIDENNLTITFSGDESGKAYMN